jgi:uncharacterized membrane protein YqjE
MVQEVKHGNKDERSIGELFADLSRETTELVRQEMALAKGELSELGTLLGQLARESTTLIHQEVELAKAEVSQKAAQAARSAAMIAVGGLLAYAGLLALLACVIIALAHALPWWLSALIVGVVVIAAGGALIYSGLQGLKPAKLAPRQTLETLKEDATWAKDQTT